jgi:hypothetical protein
MNVFDFITQDELESLPDDPTMAFTQLVRTAQGRLRDELRSYGSEDDRYVQDCQFSFQNFIIGAAKSYGITPFDSMEVPLPDKFGDVDVRRFKADLDHYMTQMVVGNALRSKRDSIPIPDKLKDRIRSHLEALRACIDESNLSEARKAVLRKKLDEFKANLEKSRVPLWAVSLFLLEIMAHSADGIALYESATVNKLVSNIMAAVAEAKAVDDADRRLPPHDPPKLLMPPRIEERSRRATTRETFSSDLDDEIPF